MVDDSIESVIESARRNSTCTPFVFSQ